MAETPAALQLRLLQTVVEVAAEKNSTLVLPFPVELLRFLESATIPAATEPAATIPAVTEPAVTELAATAEPGPTRPASIAAPRTALPGVVLDHSLAELAGMAPALAGLAKTEGSSPMTL
jgi:hypothetical protein